MPKRALAALTTLILAGFCARDVKAQAWVPPKGEGSVSVLYQDLFVRDHFLAGGGRINRGEIHSDNLIVDVTYGLTDRIAVAFAVPFVQARYAGSNPHPRAQDNGEAHSGFQNLRFNVRYNAFDGPLTVTPFVGTNMPSHDYEYFAHAAYGTRVRELDVGTYVGRMLGPALPDTFVQVRVLVCLRGTNRRHSPRPQQPGHRGRPLHHAGRQSVRNQHRTENARRNRHARRRLASHASDLGPHHDRVARLDMLEVGGGLQMTVTRSIDVFGSFMTALAGRNSHALARGITVGASWRFGRGVGAFADARSQPESRTTDAEQPLIRCLCQK